MTRRSSRRPTRRASRWSSRAGATSAISPAGAEGGGGIERIASGGPWEERFGYCRAVRAGGFVYVAGTTAVDEDGVVRGIGDAGEQTTFILEQIAAALVLAGARMQDVVRTRMFVTDISRAEEIGRAHAAAFAAHPPVATMVQVAALLDPRMLVEIEAEAYIGSVASLSV